MLEPMARAGTAGYVPLCAAIPWIMTNGGSLVKQLKDEEALERQHCAAASAHFDW
jgi:hypothetical protein